MTTYHFTSFTHTTGLTRFLDSEQRLQKNDLFHFHCPSNSGALCYVAGRYADGWMHGVKLKLRQ